VHSLHQHAGNLSWTYREFDEIAREITSIIIDRLSEIFIATRSLFAFFHALFHPKSVAFAP
jgi:hypothetical protein